MKAALGKTISGISSFTRGTYNVLTLSRLRRSESEVKPDEDAVKDRELNSIDGASAANTHDCARGSQAQGRSLGLPHTPPPPRLPITQEDDILYRKNNVYLKYQTGAKQRSETSSSSSLDGSSSSSSSPAVQSLRMLQGSPAPKPKAEQRADKVPGFLFIASRGSNYGSTLILNWAPNSTMIKCSVSINSTVCTAGESSGNELTSSTSSGRSQAGEAAASTALQATSLRPPSPSPRTEHTCVSIDLGEMEVIRVFYHTEDNSDGMVSGEMVVSSKQTDFWVFHFQNGGLTDLIHLFRSWKYFSHQQHRYHM